MGKRRKREAVPIPRPVSIADQWKIAYTQLTRKNPDGVMQVYDWLIFAIAAYQLSSQFAHQLAGKIKREDSLSARSNYDDLMEQAHHLRIKWDEFLDDCHTGLTTSYYPLNFGEDKRIKLLFVFRNEGRIDNSMLSEALAAFRPFIYSRHNGYQAAERAQKKAMRTGNFDAQVAHSSRYLEYYSNGTEKCYVCRTYLSTTRCGNCRRCICPRCGNCSTSCDERWKRRDSQEYRAFTGSRAGFIPDERWYEMRKVQKEYVGRPIDFDVDPKGRS